MDDDVVISLSNVSKCFRRYGKPIDRLKELILPTNRYAEDFWALKGISLDIYRGETLGIIGQNGSGKSTLLQIIAGTLQPTEGSVSVNGRVSALLELGSGFNPEFTGRQNVFFNGRILGLTQTEIENKFDEIAAFADIGDFIDQPVKFYSSGMFVRLAFSVAIHVNPQVFIVDEALAVGDVFFQHRCMRKIKSLMDSGVTTLFVSHDAGAVKALCNRSLMLCEGKNYLVGDPDTVIIEYMKKVAELDTKEYVVNKSESTSSQSNLLRSNTPEEDRNSLFQNRRHDGEKERILNQSSDLLNLANNLSQRGNNEAEITGLAFFKADGEWSGHSPTFDFNEKVTLIIRIRANNPLENGIVGFFLRDKNGYEILGSNTEEEGHKLKSIRKLEEIDVLFEFNLPLKSGSYSLTVAIAESYTSGTSNWLDNVLVLQVLPPSNGKKIFGMIDIPMNLTVNRL